MKEDKSLIVEFVKQVFTTFAAAIIAISIVGWFMGDAEKGSGGLFDLGSRGLSYRSMLQILIFSFTIGVFRILLLSDLIIKKMMLLWKMMLMFFLSFVSATLCSILFHWFPIESRHAWISFIISISVCFVIGVLAMIVKTKLEDRKYHKLLSAYKEKQKMESGDER